MTERPPAPPLWRNRARAALVRLGFALGRLRRPRRVVVLATSHADRLSGNLAWIRDALARDQPGTPIAVVAGRAREGLGGVLAGIWFSIRAGWHLASARVFVVDDYFFPRYVVPRRPATSTVQVWHACGAFKRFGYSVVDRGFGADEAAVAAIPIHVNYDLCLVSSARFTPAYAEAFRQPERLFTAALGIPRTDLFFDTTRQAASIDRLRRRYGLPQDRRLILYAPTFRGARATNARSPIDLDLAAVHAALGLDHVLLLREHPFARAVRRRSGPLPESVLDVSDWPDLNELMLVSDILVTDYSSAIYEFALLRRPIVFFAPDHAAYEAERGFYLDWPADLPGPVFETTEALVSGIRAWDFDLDRVGRFAAASFDVADGHATERLLREVILPGLG